MGLRASGEWEDPTRPTPLARLFFAPEGVRQGPHVAKTEVISLTF